MKKLFKGYAEKHWGSDYKDLSACIIKRLVRLTFDNNYFNALYQGIPIGGYTKLIENLLDGIKDAEGNDLPKTVSSYEYSSEWKPGDEPYYPVNDEKNGKLYL